MDLCSEKENLVPTIKQRTGFCYNHFSSGDNTDIHGMALGNLERICAWIYPGNAEKLSHGDPSHILLAALPVFKGGP